MTQDKAPELAEAKADKLLGVGWGKEMQGVRQTMHRNIALALSQAYERGQESMRERAAQVLHDIPDANSDVRGPLYATGWTSGIRSSESIIRSLPIEQEGGE